MTIYECDKCKNTYKEPLRLLEIFISDEATGASDPLLSMDVCNHCANVILSEVKRPPTPKDRGKR